MQRCPPSVRKQYNVSDPADKGSRQAHVITEVETREVPRAAAASTPLEGRRVTQHAQPFPSLAATLLLSANLSAGVDACVADVRTCLAGAHDTLLHLRTHQSRSMWSCQPDEETCVCAVRNRRARLTR